MFEQIILVGLSISMMLLWIYESDVIWEYLSLISKRWGNTKFDGILLLTAWSRARPSGQYKNYLDFLNVIYNKFFTRLLACPICLSFWISLLASLITQNVLGFFGIAFFALVGFFILKLLTNKVKSL